jgi:hypothetical protein
MRSCNLIAFESNITELCKKNSSDASFEPLFLIVSLASVPKINMLLFLLEESDQSDFRICEPWDHSVLFCLVPSSL